MNQSVSMTNQLELPPDFHHEPPKGYHYEVEQFRRNVYRICIVNDGTFSYTNDPPKCVWGFIKTTGKKGSTETTYYAPINYNKVGDSVRIEDTRSYTAMQLNLNPLETVLYG